MTIGAGTQRRADGLRGQGSNLQHPDSKSGVLPVELPRTGGSEASAGRRERTVQLAVTLAPVRTPDDEPAAPRLSPDLERVAAEDLYDDADGPEWAGLAVRGDLTGWEAERLTVTGCRLEGVVATGAVLERARFVDVELDSCDLSGAMFEGSSFERVVLRQCRIVGALLGGARLRNVRIEGCKVDRSALNATVAERLHVTGSMLVECDLRDARWPGAVVAGCDLTGADVSGADLRGARLSGSQLALLRGVRGLAGAEVDIDQLHALAALLAADAGIVVREVSHPDVSHDGRPSR